MSRNPQLVFLHLFKCGGTSIIHRLREMTGEDNFYHFRSRQEANALLENNPAAFSRVAVVAGHMQLEYVERNFPSAAKMTVLRNPVDRLISQYFHFRREYSELNDQSRPMVVKRAQFCAHHDFAAYATADDPEISLFTRNFMIRNLSHAGPDADPDSPALLNDALATLTSFDLVSVSDRLDDALFTQIKSFLAHPDALLRQGLLARSLSRTIKNASEERKLAQLTISTEIMDAIMRRNWLDMQLYQRVKWFGV